MSKFEVKVLGSKPPKRPDGPLKRLRRRIGHISKAVLMRPRLIVLTAITGSLLVIGTPHVGWEYQCGHQTRGFGSCRYVSWCAYYGVQGRRVERPSYGERCQVVTVLPLDWNKMLGGL